MTNIFPVALILMNLGASIVYGACGEPVKAVYWTAAMTLNICILLMK